MTKPFDEGRLQAPSHTFQIFNPILFQKTIDQMVVKIEKLRALYPEIEAIAACGMSGLVLAGAVSARLQLPIIAVRKTMDTTHDDRMVNGHLGAKGYLFIDDLICSGKTVDHVIGEIDRAARWYYPEEAPPRLVGCVLYYDTSHDNYPRWVGGSGKLGRRLGTRTWGCFCDNEELTWYGNNDVSLAEELGGPAPQPYPHGGWGKPDLYQGKYFRQELRNGMIYTVPLTDADRLEAPKPAPSNVIQLNPSRSCS